MSRKLLIKKLFESIDEDKDGLINYKELKKWRETTLTKYKIISKDIPRTQRLFFDLFDIDKNNLITFEEFSVCFEKYLENIS